MACLECQTENPQGARYCLNCGSTLVAGCPECGIELPVETKFCYECGARVDRKRISPGREISPSPISSAIQRLLPLAYSNRLQEAGGHISHERRLVTILFSDIKGSTAMAENLDPEDVLEIINGAFEVMIEPVYRYEGTLARLMGDGMLAFFGAPIAHEDDPERAVRAGLDILAGAKKFAQQLTRVRGIEDFNVRVGINTGLVVVGEVGNDLRVEYTAVGDAINLAARLEGLAEPGTVLISDATYQFVHSFFETLALAPQVVKGRSKPVSIYQILKPIASRTKLRGIPGLDSPLVGRDVELGNLYEQYNRLIVGVGGIVTVIGEAGIGKSRLVAEFRKRTNKQAVTWIEGRCQSYATVDAYHPWRNILIDLIELADPSRYDLGELIDRLSRLGIDPSSKLLAATAGLLNIGTDSLNFSEEGSDPRDLIFVGIQQLLYGISATKPLVIVFEDLQWADRSSVELINRLFPLTETSPILYVLIFRSDRGLPSWRLREKIIRLYPHRHFDIQLKALTRMESEQLVNYLVGSEIFPEKLFQKIISQAGGNPFYIEEQIRSLIDDRLIQQDPSTGRWLAVSDREPLPLPENLLGLLNARIDRLSQDARRVLQVASVIGRRFSIDLLSEMLTHDPDLIPNLVELQRAMMIREIARLPSMAYTFQHQLTHQAVYDGLTIKERKSIHHKIAEIFEQVYPEQVEENLAYLAYHWENSGDKRKAVEYLIKAGDQARGRYAHTESERYYQKAVSILEVNGEQERAARTLMKLALVYTASFQTGKAQNAYQRAFSIWEPLREVKAITQGYNPAVLKFAIEQPPELDPGKLSDDVSIFVSAQIFEGLVRIGRDYTVLPAAAERWTISGDGTRYVFFLQEGQRWSDGSRLTAHDFRYAWIRNLHPDTRSPLANLLYAIKNASPYARGELVDRDQIGIYALDELALEVVLERPTAYFPFVLAQSVAYPLKRNLADAVGSEWLAPGNLISNGPYMLEEWTPGERLVLSRNPYYGGDLPGNVARIELPIHTSFRPMLHAYNEDQIDAAGMFNVDPGLIAQAQGKYADQLVAIPRPSTLFINFRTDRAPFNDRRVRKAFICAVDREALVEWVCFGQRLPGTGGFIPDGMAGHAPAAGLEYDTQRARELIEKAGYAAGVGFPTIEWLCGLGSEEQGIVEYLRDSWRDVLGIELDSRALELSQFLSRLLEDPAEITIVGWSADFPDPDYMLRPTFHSRQGANVPRWSNAEYDGLLEEAAGIIDHERRIELYRKADRILVRDEAVVMPLTYGLGRMLVKPWVRLPESLSVQMPLKSFLVDMNGKQ